MDENKTPEEICQEASPEVMKIITKVLKIEREHLFERRAHGIVDELLRIFKEEVR